MIKVTLVPHPSKYRVSIILVNEEPWAEIATSIVNRSDLFASYTSLNAWKEVWNRWEKTQVKILAYRKIAQKRYFEAELKKVLCRYGFSLQAVDTCLKDIKDAGYLNDEEGKEVLIAKGIRKKKGPAWIKYELAKKGSISDFDQEKFYPKEQRDEAIREFFRKYPKKGQKGIASLVRKGFAFDEVLAVYQSLF